MTRVAVLADSYMGLVAAIAIKIKNPEFNVCAVGVISAQHGAVQLQINKHKISRLLKIDLTTLFALCDATISSALCIKSNEFYEFNLANDSYGSSQEIADFHQLFIRLKGDNYRFDDYSIQSVAAKKSKVVDPFSRNSKKGPGFNLNEKPLTKILINRARQVGVDILNDNICHIESTILGKHIITEKNKKLDIDTIVDVRDYKHLEYFENPEFVDWSDFFYFSRSSACFKFNERITDPKNIVELGGGRAVKKIPLRSGVQYEYWQARQLGEAVCVRSYGRSANIWQENYIYLGKNSIRAGGYFVSDLDILLEVLDVLLQLWSGKSDGNSLKQEFNRRVCNIYDSLLAFHLLIDMSWCPSFSWWNVALPKQLTEDLLLFSCCGKLNKIDGRYPDIDLWIAMLMSLKVSENCWPIVGCEKTNEEVERDLFLQLKSIETLIEKSPSHIEFVNNLLKNISTR